MAKIFKVESLVVDTGFLYALADRKDRGIRPRHGLSRIFTED